MSYRNDACKWTGLGVFVLVNFVIVCLFEDILLGTDESGQSEFLTSPVCSSHHHDGRRFRHFFVRSLTYLSLTWTEWRNGAV